MLCWVTEHLGAIPLLSEVWLPARDVYLQESREEPPPPAEGQNFLHVLQAVLFVVSGQEILGFEMWAADKATRNRRCLALSEIREGNA